jgi:hypothetical protein
MAGLLHFTVVVAVAATFFFFLIKTGKRPLPYPYPRPQNPSQLPGIVSKEPVRDLDSQTVVPVVPVPEKSNIHESSPVNTLGILSDVEAEPEVSDSVELPGPSSSGTQQSDSPPVSQQSIQPDSGSMPEVLEPPAVGKQDPAETSPSKVGENDRTHRKKKDDRPADITADPTQNIDPVPDPPAGISPPAQKEYEPPPVLVTSLMDIQDWRLLNKYLEKGKSYLHYSWGNRISGFLFEIAPRPAYGRSKICRDATLHARVDILGGKRQTVYTQKITCCRSSRGIWTPQLPDNICATY